MPAKEVKKGTFINGIVKSDKQVIVNTDKKNVMKRNMSMKSDKQVIVNTDKRKSYEDEYEHDNGT